MTIAITKKISALVAAGLLTMLALSACQTQPGTAAYVGDNRITVAHLNDLVDEAAEDPYWGEAVKSERALAAQHTLNVLVLNELLSRGARDLDIHVPRSLIDDKRENLVSAPTQRAPLLQGVPVELAAVTDAYIDAVGEVVTGDATTTAEIDARWNEYLSELIKKHPVKINPRYGVLEPGTLVLIAAGDPAVREI